MYSGLNYKYSGHILALFLTLILTISCGGGSSDDEDIIVQQPSNLEIEAILKIFSLLSGVFVSASFNPKDWV